MRVIRELNEIGGGGGVLVPTMGALHEGHASLIRLAAQHRRAKPRLAGPITVSIFVNPTQFNDPADFKRYPRTLDADLAICENAGADAVFAPPPEVMYPPGEQVPVPPLPEVATKPGLEDAHRPGHFAGVCQVVLRLFTLLRPASALFGEKDWQQLQVVKAMTAQQRLPIEIVPATTVRARGGTGLALSSRNAFLSSEERDRAAVLEAALSLAGTKEDPAEAELAMHFVLGTRGVRPEYAVIRDAETLGPYSREKPGRALIAARVGTVRLIDNSQWPCLG